MSYIGRKPTVGNFQICDAISVVNGQAAYTMQVGSVNVIPQSANHMIVSLNGTIQKPNSSFTVSGSTITFASNLATGDVIDFIQILGDVLDLGVPSDGTVTSAKLASTSVTAAKLNNDIISGSTELASEPADTDEFLVSDAGTLKRIDYSLIKGGGMDLLSTTTISGTPSSIAFDNTLITSTYDNYTIIGSSLEPTADLNLGFGISTDNGSSGTAQEYNNSRYLQLSANTIGFNSTTVSVNSVNGPLIGELNDGKLGCFILQIFNTQATVRGTYLRYESIYENASGVPYSLQGATIFSNTSAINHVQVATSTSTFQSGFVSLYGMRK